MIASRRKKEWPPWWDWELDLRPHVEERMEDRRFTEVELRRMMEIANDCNPARRAGRWVIETKHQGRRWEVIVEPNPADELIEVITAYAVKRRNR
jgi:hypothetical protein